MQKLITKYGLAAHLALLAVAPLFLSPAWVLWLSALGAIWLIMEPSRIGEEMLHEARRRVAGEIVRDPFFWVSLALVAFAALRWVNGGITMVYDAENTTWSLHPPRFEILPGSVSGFGAVEFCASVAMVVVLQGGRHALGKSARWAFFLISSFLASLAAIRLSVAMFYGDADVLRQSACPVSDPVHIGMAFGVYSLVAMMALLAAFERKWRKSMPLALIAVIGNAAGLFLFAPSFVVAAFGAVSVVLFLYAFTYARMALPGSGAFKFLVAFGMSLVVAGVIAVAVLPESSLPGKLSPFKTGLFWTPDYLSLREAVSGIAMKVWKAHPWIGSGLGSFPLDIKFLATEQDWSVIATERTPTLNGYWLLLSERGIIGAFAVACPLCLLLWTYGVRMVKGVMCRTLPHPASWMALLLLLALAACGVLDTTILFPGIMLSVAMVLAISANSFPKEKHHG